jgi:succinate dehydrogenase/fumarate reductase flavoprotein subunit
MSLESLASEPRPASSVASWDHEADVVIIGYGGAGVCAGIEAGRAGASVLALERASGGGGTTAIAAGHLYLGGGTRAQKAAGYEDSPENMFNYFMQCSDDPDEEKVRIYCDNSVEHFEWLVSLGVPFKDTVLEERVVMQKSDDGIIWSGNEKAYPFREHATPMPRGHKPMVEDEGGPLLFAKLHQAAQKAGVEVLYDTRVLTLVIREDGRVLGAIARKDGKQISVRANKGVILCTGGFAMNEHMMRRHIPRLVGKVLPIGNPYDDGAGIRMGMAARGSTIHMDSNHITMPHYPPSSNTKGILVNGQGQRFINEDCYHGRVAAAAAQQPEGRVYLIADNGCFGWPEFGGFELVDTCETIAELEQAMGLPASMLQHTVEVYNRYAKNGEDPLFHKQPAWLEPLDEPPFAALECSLGKAPYMAFPLGGLWTRPTGEVLTEDGDPIPGLYAAGRTTCGISRSAEGYASGTCIADATYFGRLAGKTMAAAEAWR